MNFILNIQLSFKLYENNYISDAEAIRWKGDFNIKIMRCDNFQLDSIRNDNYDCDCICIGVIVTYNKLCSPRSFRL